MKEEEKLASREFWVSYWSEMKPYRVETIDFTHLFQRFPAGTEMIEIGGFPGKYPIYLKKYFGHNVTIFDYVIVPGVVDKMCAANDLPPDSFKVIEGDFFSENLDEKYDVAFSIGFIEHFGNTEEIIRRHLRLVKPSGTVIITLPNFRGVNGLVQRIFDRKLYRAHNIGIMRLSVLKECCKNAGLTRFEVFYSEKPRLWMDRTAKGGYLVRGVVSRISRIIGRFRSKKGGRWLSPFIVITALNEDLGK